jgi:hypothetical protein
MTSPAFSFDKFYTELQKLSGSGSDWSLESWDDDREAILVEYLLATGAHLIDGYK